MPLKTFSEFDDEQDNFIPETDYIPEDDGFVHDEDIVDEYVNETDDTKPLIVPKLDKTLRKRKTKTKKRKTDPDYESDPEFDEDDLNDSDFQDSDPGSDNDYDNDGNKISKKKEAKEVPDLSCQFCGKNYQRQKKLDEHIEKHHGSADPNDANAEPLKFKCGFCDLSFKDRRMLTCVSSAMTPKTFFFKILLFLKLFL